MQFGWARLARIPAAGGRKRGSAWSDQFEALTLALTSAHNHEMPALTSDESVPVVEFLMSLPNPTPEEVAAVNDAEGWLKKVEISGYR